MTANEEEVHLVFTPGMEKVVPPVEESRADQEWMRL